MLGVEKGRLDGKCATHKTTGRRVYVTEHNYSVDGRLSNWANFVFINPKTGRPTNQASGCYDSGEFTNICDPVIVDPKTIK